MATRTAALRFARTTSRAPADWIVLDLHGSYPTFDTGSPLPAMLRREESFHALSQRLAKLAAAPWLTGVLVRVGDLTTGLTTTFNLTPGTGPARRRQKSGGLPAAAHHAHAAAHRAIARHRGTALG